MYCINSSIVFILFFNIFIEIPRNKADPISDNDLQTLELVHIIFRHGNRTPIPYSLFPTDANKDNTYYPYGMGELNFDGKKNAYNLGLEIRERYNGFIPEVYFPPDIKAYTSNTSRTQMTLQLVLAAMFPPVWPNVFLPYLMWQPISYETIPDRDDNLIRPDAKCPQLQQFTTDIDSESQKLYDYVANYSGAKMENSHSLMNVYNTILVEKENGLDVPTWAEEIFNNGELEAAALNNWQDIIDQKLPITVGGLIKKITTDSVNQTNPKSEITNKVFLYSGHDLTIAALLGAFDSYDKTQIEYTAHIYIESHKVNNEYGFKIYYKNGPSNPLIPLKFKKCTQEFCTMEDFVESTQDLYTPEPQCQ